MKKLLRILKSRFTMKRIDFLFTDMVTWDEVHSYEDCYGTMYMANYPWLPWGFRVEMPDRYPHESYIPAL